ncbi:hypothetical protein, partial [Vibrio cholerae]|uniref:hypothetical protein n=1 Tax=Vibrio cholerae TaxID=666 RepID=UPI001F2B41A7
PFVCYSYDPDARRGRWSDSHGSCLATPQPPAQVRFAALLTLTPVPHYTLLERVNSVRLARSRIL